MLYNLAIDPDEGSGTVCRTMERYVYAVALSADDDGRVVAVFPEFDDTPSDGTDRAEALSQAVDYLEKAIARRIVRREDILPALANRAGPRSRRGP